MLTVTDANNHTVTNKYDADGHLDSFTYNGLGMRLTKRDPSGNYAYFADGLTPASSVLSDNFTTFTPGISEYNALGSRFYLADASGNSRGLLNGSSVDTDGYNWEAFGTLVSRFGNNPTGFAWNVDSGYQADNDDGLALLGHRYYDKRTGRFISQDPAGDGNNWYGYAGNDPMNNTDPTGLVIAGGGMGMFQDPSQAGISYDPSNDVDSQYMQDHPGEYNFYDGKTGNYLGSQWKGATAWDQMNNSMGGGSPGAGMVGMGGAMFAMHNSNKRASTKGPHEKGVARWLADTQKNEKGDKRRQDAIDDRNAKKTGVSTRDPDGSVRRARAAAEQAAEAQAENSRKTGFVEKAEEEIDAFLDSFGKSQLNGAGAGENALEQASME